MMKLPIYLDHHATTPVDPRVLEKMLPYFTEVYGNAASNNHIYGRNAFNAVEESREKLAKLINARSQEVIFTSGATESINLAIKGLTNKLSKNNPHFITVATEHKAVLDCFSWLEKNGFDITILPVDSGGMLDPQAVANAIKSETAMVSVMFANNEIGVIQPIKEIGKICKKHDVLFMTDATQSFGKVSIDVKEMNINLLACSAHKIYGPKGIGMLYVSRSNPRVKLHAIIDGGGHERGMRSGTLDVPSIVGFSEAAVISNKEMKTEQARIMKLRDELQNSLLERIPNMKINGDLNNRLAGNLNIALPQVDSEALMIALKGEIAISSGSACTSAAILPSHVLEAIGCSEDEIHSSIRIGIGRGSNEHQIRLTSNKIAEECSRLLSFNV
jgi:cysteine desulfurase